MLFICNNNFFFLTLTIPSVYVSVLLFSFIHKFKFMFFFFLSSSSYHNLIMLTFCSLFGIELGSVSFVLSNKFIH